MVLVRSQRRKAREATRFSRTTAMMKRAVSPAGFLSQRRKAFPAGLPLFSSIFSFSSVSHNQPLLEFSMLRTVSTRKTAAREIK